MENQTHLTQMLSILNLTDVLVVEPLTTKYETVLTRNGINRTDATDQNHQDHHLKLKNIGVRFIKEMPPSAVQRYRARIYAE